MPTNKRIITCYVCQNENIFDCDDTSILCLKCNALLNLKTKPLDYSSGGGQDVPSDEKTKLRIQNALKRFEIIHPHIRNHTIFIDIGCGSGEMLEASKKYFEYYIGYDENKLLIDYTTKKGLNTYNKYFSRDDIPKSIRGGIVLTINHVLEHIQNPLLMLKNIVSQLNEGDLIYIEVPLHTGYSFKRKKYTWSLWYDEHLALYSMDTLHYIANELDCEVIDYGYRNFISENYNKKLAIKLFFSNPITFILNLLCKKKYHLMLDNILKDYGFIVLKI